NIQGTSPLAFLTMVYVLSFVPWFFMPRSAFYYHYTPAVPFSALFLALWLYELYATRSRHAHTRALLFIVLATLVWVFWLYYPRWVGLPVSADFSRALYQLLPSWR